jgi:hypothetical protein
VIFHLIESCWLLFLLRDVNTLLQRNQALQSASRFLSFRL